MKFIQLGLRILEQDYCQLVAAQDARTHMSNEDA